MNVKNSGRLPLHLWVLAVLYFAASLTHFFHNAEYIAFYPNMPAWLTSEQVYMVWVGVTSIGISALILHVLKRRLSSLVALGIYGAFGFDALGHYALALCSQHSLVMNATIWSEVITGGLLLGACARQVLISRRRMYLEPVQSAPVKVATPAAIGIDAGNGKLPVLAYLQKYLAGDLLPGETTHMQYPTGISQTLGIRIVEVGKGTATVEIDASPALHGNQQGTIHGGLMCELADAAIGTAHSTLMAEDESFASIDLKINFFRPVWTSTLRAVAKPIQSGRTITHYSVDIFRDDGKHAATVISSVMTLRGEKAQGR